MTEAEFLKAIEDWAGGPLSARAWYFERQIPCYGGRTLAEVHKERGDSELAIYYDLVASGAFA